jgi:hypothetical protein
MPLRNLSKQSEPKDHKQVLLDLIAQQYGPSNAVVMDKALKTQDKQIEQAMLEGGATAEDIGKSKGIDLNLLNALINSSGGVKAVGDTPLPKDSSTKPASSPFGFGGMSMQDGQMVEQKPGFLAALLSTVLSGSSDLAARMDLDKIKKQSEVSENLANVNKLNQDSLGSGEERETLIAQRKANTDLMNRQLEGFNNSATKIIYRDPVTGEEVDQATAEKDMAEGLGVYQMNQIMSTRSGLVEKPLNKVPDLNREEKQYVNDARLVNNSLTNIESGYDKLYNKFKGTGWQSFQIEKVPFYLAKDPDVQNLKSELNYIKGRITFMRGGTALTKTEAARIDVLVNPFGKNRETYKKDINRLQDEFLTGSSIAKFGVNSGLMDKMIKADKKKKTVSNNNSGTKTITLPSGKVITIGK